MAESTSTSKYFSGVKRDTKNKVSRTNVKKPPIKIKCEENAHQEEETGTRNKVSQTNVKKPPIEIKYEENAYQEEETGTRNKVSQTNVKKPPIKIKYEGNAYQEEETGTRNKVSQTNVKKPPIKIKYEENAYQEEETGTRNKVSQTNVKKPPIKIKYEENAYQEEETGTKNRVSQTNVKKPSIKIKYEENVYQEEETSGMKAKRIKKEVDDVDEKQQAIWFPNNWKLLLENIKEMRRDRTAVVDSQGCERTADLNENPEIIRYQTLVSLMLSSQTRDQVTFAAMQKLKNHGLSPDKIMKLTEAEIGKLIYPVGFWKRKSSYILNTSRICYEEYHNDIPDSIEGLVALPGVGPKMAYICMSVAWGKVDGIGVDTHVHRIANWLKWVRKPTRFPEQTRKELEKWLPREEWKDINILLVGFGQQTCLPVYPKCSDCLNKDICPSSRSKNRNIKKMKLEPPG